MFTSIKNGIARKTALSVSDLSAAHLERLRAGGVDAIEISMKSQQHPMIDWRQVVRDAARNEVALWSFHLPFLPFCAHDISSRDPFVRRTTVDYLKVLIDRAAGLPESARWSFTPAGSRSPRRSARSA